MTYQSNLWLKTMCVLLFSLVLNFQTFANNNSPNPWNRIAEMEFAKKEMERPIIPKKYLTYRLDLEALQTILSTAPLRFSEASYQQEVAIELPMPNGEMQRFQIFDAPIMEPELAAKFPMIHSYAGVGLDDPTASLRFDVTQFGFHALVLSTNGTVYIDPYSKSDTEHYVVYYKNDFEKLNNDFVCHLKTENNQVDDDADSDVSALNQGSCELRTYRLALSCTGEYAQFHGGTVNSVVAAMNTTMTRVNGIFEREFNANMVLVANNENLIFLDTNTDPYDDSSTSQLINESHTQCNAIIGSANYDIGHVFSTGGGGLAGLGVVCNTNNKGRGVTGTNSPVGDPFDVDYVAHEIGHQFGANHTFNNSCSSNRNSSTAMEPGSASTIMGYAGICSPNVQFKSDDYFHAISIQEVSNYINNSTGNSCAVTTATSNNAPTVDAGADYVLPISTPFKLDAIGSDQDGNAITYCWEQMDNQIATMPPVSTSTSGPAFRSFDPTQNSYRYFPKIEDIVDGIDDDWEELPSVSRSMDFRVTVRDNNQGSGCTVEDDVTLTFSDSAGPFVVQSPNYEMVWFGGTPQTITWDVANTDVAPVNCTHVDILLSYDGGYTYSTTLASSVPNDGSHVVTIPTQASATCRVMVKGSNNVFFDISDNDFKIETPNSPTFVMNVDPTVQDICGSVGSVSYEMDLTGLSGFNDMVTLSVAGLPANVQESFSENNFVPTSGSTLTLSNLANVPNGFYYFSLIATSNLVTNEEILYLTINNSTPDIAILNTPIDGATSQNVDPELTWGAMPNTTSYDIELGVAPNFWGNVMTKTVTNNTFTPTGLQPLTVYYWRVKGINNCGSGTASDWFSFQTAGDGCYTYESADTPLNITDASATTVNSVIAINDDLTITSIKPSLDISHSWTGDLKASLVSPSAETKLLFESPGIPASQWGCGEDNILATFDDNASNTAADFEGTCNSGAAYAIEGTYQPVDAFTSIVGQSSVGDWTLKVEDLYGNDGGALEEWNLEICFSQTAGDAPTLTKNILSVPANSTELISSNNLQANSSTNTASQMKYVILSLPQYGLLAMNGIDVIVGTTFTQTEIDNNTFTYYNIDGSATADNFTFDIITADGGWMKNEVFDINIVAPVLSATVEIEVPISCHNENDGMVVVNATGANPPFTYSLNGAAYQTSNIFASLIAGAYTVDVKDNLGNIITTSSVVLTNPIELTISAVADGGTVTATASGGAGNFVYNILGMPSQTSPVFENLSQGTYTVIVTDGQGCTNQTTVEVQGAPLVAAAFAEIPMICHNEDYGTIIVNATGGTPPFQYSINGQPYQPWNTFHGLTAGVYNINVKDALENVVATTPVEIFYAPPLTVSAQANGNTVTVSADGGFGGFTYSIAGIPSQTSPVFENLAIGTYTVMVTDQQGCSGETEIQVQSGATLSASVMIEIPIYCFGENSGMLIVEATGGTPPFEYSMNGGTYQSSNVFSNLSAGQYEFDVKDSLGNIVNTSFIELIDPLELTVSAVADGSTVTVTANGGVGNFIYHIIGLPDQTSPVFENLTGGTYTVIVADGLGCTNETTVEVQGVPLVASAEVEVQVSCHGGSDGMIFAIASGGIAPFEYSLNGTDFQSSEVFDNLTAGAYTITVKDSQGNTITTNSVTINNPTELEGVAMVIGNMVTINATGGTGSLMYNINGSNYQTSNVFTFMPNGQFNFGVIDENQCTITVGATVDAIESASVSTTVTNCFDSQDGSLTIHEVIGGVSPYLYSLDNNNFSSTTTYNNLAPGNYSVFVMDATSAVFEAGTYQVEGAPNLSVTVQAVDNSITANGTGGTGDLMYSIDGVNFQENNTFTDLANGDYIVTVMDENECTNQSIELSINFTALNELDFDINFELFPNPNLGQFTIELNQPTAKNLRLQIFDAAGKLVQAISLDKDGNNLKAQIDVSHLATGSYELLLTDGEMYGRKRFVKE